VKPQRAQWFAITHASELLTGAGLRLNDGRHPKEEDLGRIVDGALVYEVIRVGKKKVPGKVLWVGATRDLPKRFRDSRRTLNLKNKKILIPGLVDCHTHLVFSGDRSEEFSRRCGGESYESIAASGGGIVTTVQSTRNASERELLALAIARVRESMSFGVRTLEIKSGYGLDEDSEIKQLRVIRKLQLRFPELKIQSTFLGAHAVPQGRDRSKYVGEILEQILPRVAREKLADAVDVFVDRGYFDAEDARRILSQAKSAGLLCKIHADELSNTESAALAAELGALSADHLLQVSENGIRSLARSQTTAVLLPGTAFYLKAQHAPARKLLDAGVRVAISTDFNPGTCVTLNLPAVMTIAALYLEMTRAEIFCSVTYSAARALGFHSQRGTLEKGLDAAFAIFPVRRFEELYYRFAWSA